MRVAATMIALWVALATAGAAQEAMRLLVALCLAVVPHVAAQPCGPSPVRFTNQLIASDYTYAYGIAVGDLDRDGDMDVTSADTTSDVLYWYANDGAGSFQRHVIEADDAGWFERHALVDLDGNGFLDVVVVKIADGSIAWYANDGTPEDGGWQERLIADGTLLYAYDVDVGDLDGDGDLDVVMAMGGAVSTKGEVVWFENRGRARRWCKHVLFDVWQNGNSVLLRDLNGDGRLDLLSTAERGTNELRWWRNDGP